MADNKYVIESASTGRSSCKGCKQKIDKGVLRIGKISANPFGDDGDSMKVWYHAACMFDAQTRTRGTTKRIEDSDDLDGFNALSASDQAEVGKMIDGRYDMLC